MSDKHTIWWTPEEAAQAVSILNQLMEDKYGGLGAFAFGLDVPPALGIAIDAIQVLEYAIKHASPNTSTEIQDIVTE